MKNLFDPATAAEVKERLARIRSDSQRQWGKMGVAQMVAHCVAGMEMALGERNEPRALIGYVLGGIIKPLALRDDAPMRRNSPTLKSLIFNDDRDLEVERAKLSALIDRFVAGGPAGCSTHPHSFFGRLTPDEWSILAYKHLDHHLRQFSC
jgi:hypothetical protein